MTTSAAIEELCSLAVAKQEEWRAGGADGRREAYAHFDRCLHAIATGRSYDEVLYEAVEDWVTAKFCCVGKARRLADVAASAVANRRRGQTAAVRSAHRRLPPDPVRLAHPGAVAARRPSRGPGCGTVGTTG